MRNKYPDICYRCGKMVKPGDGYSERVYGKGRRSRWRVQHATCCTNARIARELRQTLAEAAQKALRATESNQQERSLFDSL